MPQASTYQTSFPFQLGWWLAPTVRIPICITRNGVRNPCLLSLSVLLVNTCIVNMRSVPSHSTRALDGLIVSDDYNSLEFVSSWRSNKNFLCHNGIEPCCQQVPVPCLHRNIFLLRRYSARAENPIAHEELFFPTLSPRSAHLAVVKSLLRLEHLLWPCCRRCFGKWTWMFNLGCRMPSNHAFITLIKMKI